MMKSAVPLILVVCVSGPAFAASFTRIAERDLCVTNGVVTTAPDGRMTVETPSSRAVLRMPSEPAAEIRFRYLGATAGSKPLASGAMRRQLGLKLRAEDSCNLLYVIWRIEPNPEIVVSVKRNPGMHAHAECGAHGYTTLKVIPMRPMRTGESHTLRAELRGLDLDVFADNASVWHGPAGRAVEDLEGPVGFRTDNAHILFDYFARGVQPEAKSNAPCNRSPGD